MIALKDVSNLIAFSKPRARKMATTSHACWGWLMSVFWRRLKVTTVYDGEEVHERQELRRMAAGIRDEDWRGPVPR